MKKSSMLALCALVILIVAGSIYFYNNKAGVGGEKSLICSQDSDCVIKTNEVNCPIAAHKDDSSEYKTQIPPSRTECPKIQEIVPFCSQGKCEIKYDCTKCAVLRAEFEDYCPSHMNGTSGWICGMYNECNC